MICFWTLPKRSYTNWHIVYSNKPMILHTLANVGLCTLKNPLLREKTTEFSSINNLVKFIFASSSRLLIFIESTRLIWSNIVLSISIARSIRIVSSSPCVKLTYPWSTKVHSMFNKGQLLISYEGSLFLFENEISLYN